MITIRKARREDAQTAWDIRTAAIRNRCVGHYPAEALAIWTAGEMRDDFAVAVEESFYVATTADRVVATGTVNLESGKVDAIFVCPDHMGIGVGKMIMSHLESIARCHGLTELHLDSTLNAAPFYRACGFCGDEVAVYISPRGIALACIPMDKRLTGGEQ
jgi:GNAT superfamily N-acetyltransferase